MQSLQTFGKGTKLDKYELREQIGKGGASIVFRAYDPDSNRDVAIKVLMTQTFVDEKYFHRFKRETKLLMKLKHPNIVPVEDYGEYNGFAYLVMPYYTTGSLADRMHKKSFSEEDRARLIQQIADALDFAHEKEIVHRDVKPGNILFDESGNALLSDFGLARTLEASISITGSNIVGTPAFISPEQARGGKADARSDQYSFGILLYQLFTGSLPFHADTPLGILVQHLQDPLPMPRSVNPDIPELIEEIILKATAKDPGQRFDSLGQLNDTYQMAMDHLANPDENPAPDIALPQSLEVTHERLSLETVTQEIRRRRVTWALTGVIFAIAFIIIATSWQNISAMFNIGDRTRAVSEQQTQSVMSDNATLSSLMATYSVLQTEGASNPLGELAPGEASIATAVAQTLTAFPPILGTTTPNSANPTQILDENALFLSLTPLNESTETSTATSTPTIFWPTSTPTNIPRPTNTRIPPTEDVCALTRVNNFQFAGPKKVTWTITNNSSQPITIFMVTLNWPAEMGALVEVKFNGTIWDGEILESPATISSWLGGEPARTLAPHTSKPISFGFSPGGSGNGFNVSISFLGGCTKFAGQ